MTAEDDMKNHVAGVLAETWNIRRTKTVPEAADIALKGGAVQMPVTILFTDLVQSSLIVDELRRTTAAKVYKAFLSTAARLVNANGGQVAAYDGDRLMGVFSGERPNTMAAKTAMQISYCVSDVIRPRLKAQFPDVAAAGLDIQHVTGIDNGEVFVVRAGVRGDNDLVWIGRAPNLAARLSEVRNCGTSVLSGDVYDNMNDEAKLNNGQNFWQQRTYRYLDREVRIYCTDMRWRI